MKNSKQFVQRLLSPAGINLNGSEDYDIQVRNSRLYDDVLAGGSLALGEAYIRGDWDCRSVDQLMDRVLRADLPKQFSGFGSVEVLKHVLLSKLTNRQTRSRSKIVGEEHYDVGNDLYDAMLGRTTAYTCGYWKGLEATPMNLDAAQESKLELVCKKIGLKEGDRVLDIGCGWGSFAKYAAKEHGAEVVGVTISKEQVELGTKRCEGLPVELRLQDYRDVDEKFDHIVSLGMFEHVGPRNYREYMKKSRECLKDDGLFLLHTIGSNTSTTKGDPWLGKHIFPGGVLPSIQQIGKASEGVFTMEDWQNLSTDYDKTLMAWLDNFEKAWPALKETGKYDEAFKRKWDYYLKMCAGTFRARTNQLWQVVFSKDGVDGGYESVR